MKNSTSLSTLSYFASVMVLFAMIGSFTSAVALARPRSEDRVVDEPAENATPDQKADVVSLAKKLSPADALALWKSATTDAQKGKIDSAISAMQTLLDSEQTTVGRDLIFLTVARLFYDRGQFEKAIAYDRLVPRTSDFWLESIEERNWASIRQNHLNEALSGLTTLMAPSLAPEIGPETYFQKAFVDFKLCDFKSVLQTTHAFEKEFKPRSERLSQLANKPHDLITEAFVRRLAKEKVTSVGLGRAARDLPRLAQRDQALLSFAQAQNFDSAYRRIGELAQRDLVELSSMVKKMNLVLVETTEYLNINESDKKAKLTHAQLDRNQIRFPYDKEVWLDELDHYQAQSAQCVKRTGG